MGSNPKRLIIIEDHDSVRVVIEQTLINSGFIVESFDTAIKALDVIRKNPPDALLLDYKLPDLTGEEVVHVLQNEKIKVPFVVMTAYGSEELAVDMMKLGAVDYISKDENLVKKLPVIFERLFQQERITELLRTSEQRLRESETRIRQITDTINDVFYLYNIKEKKYEFISSNCIDILGVSDSYFYNGENYSQNFVHQDDLEKVVQAVAKVDAGEAFDIDFRVWRGEELRWMNEKSFPILGSDNKPEKNSGIIRDITDRKTAELKMKELYEDTIKLNKMMNGREEHILELKQEVNRLSVQLGKGVVYKDTEVAV